MTKTLALVCAFGFALSGAAMAAPYKMDSAGKCHDAHGRFVKAEMCAPHGAPAAYKMDAHGKCRDQHGRYAAEKMCHT